ncbi:MAG: VanZ family protein [Sphingobacteriales bacterium]|nr:MAG: VanZ family protein [Sphingobacteriales bacterium]
MDFKKILAGLWAVLILALSALTPPSVADFRIPYIDKVAHFTMYFILTLLLYLAFKPGKDIHVGRIISIPLISFLYGLLMEFAQKKFFSGRSFEINDIVANLTGILFAVAVFGLFRLKNYKI